MGKITFRYLETAEFETMLPQLFDILHTNMSKLAPTGCGYGEDRKLWMSYIVPVLETGGKKILLVYAGGNLAGYFQYGIDGDTMQIDEVEIRPEYQRTMVFYRLCRFLMERMPENVKYLTSYVHVENHHSQSIHEGLGMERIGKNKSGTSWHYRGEAAKVAARLKR